MAGAPHSAPALSRGPILGAASVVEGNAPRTAEHRPTSPSPLAPGPVPFWAATFAQGGLQPRRIRACPELASPGPRSRRRGCDVTRVRRARVGGNPGLRPLWDRAGGCRAWTRCRAPGSALSWTSECAAPVGQAREPAGQEGTEQPGRRGGAGFEPPGAASPGRPRALRARNPPGLAPRGVTGAAALAQDDPVSFHPVAPPTNERALLRSRGPRAVPDAGCGPAVLLPRPGSRLSRGLD